MKKLYVILPVFGVLAWAVLYNSQLAPNPWIVRDETLGGSDQCPIHHVQMEKRKVRVLYGDNAGSGWLKMHRLDFGNRTEFLKAEGTAFPFSRTEAYGTDAYSNKSPGFAHIYVCPACAEALARWEANRGLR